MTIADRRRQRFTSNPKAPQSRQIATVVLSAILLSSCCTNPLTSVPGDYRFWESEEIKAARAHIVHLEDLLHQTRQEFEAAMVLASRLGEERGAVALSIESMAQEVATTRELTKEATQEIDSRILTHLLAGSGSELPISALEAWARRSLEPILSEASSLSDEVKKVAVLDNPKGSTAWRRLPSGLREGLSEIIVESQRLEEELLSSPLPAAASLEAFKREYNLLSKRVEVTAMEGRVLGPDNWKDGEVVEVLMRTLFVDEEYMNEEYRRYVLPVSLVGNELVVIGTEVMGGLQNVSFHQGSIGGRSVYVHNAIMSQLEKAVAREARGRQEHALTLKATRYEVLTLGADFLALHHVLDKRDDLDLAALQALVANIQELYGHAKRSALKGVEDHALSAGRSLGIEDGDIWAIVFPGGSDAEGQPAGTIADDLLALVTDSDAARAGTEVATDWARATQTIERSLQETTRRVVSEAEETTSEFSHTWAWVPSCLGPASQSLPALKVDGLLLSSMDEASLREHAYSFVLVGFAECPVQAALSKELEALSEVTEHLEARVAGSQDATSEDLKALQGVALRLEYALAAIEPCAVVMNMEGTAGLDRVRSTRSACSDIQRTLIKQMEVFALPARSKRPAEFDRLPEGVNSSLQWLQRHQSPQGFWDSDNFMRNNVMGDSECDGAGNSSYDVGITGLATLAFLAAGEYWRDSTYLEPTQKGLDWLIASQDPETGLIGDRDSHDYIYNHAIATLALCTAYIQAPSFTRLEAPAQGAVNYISMGRNPYGAWRYDVPPMGDNDTSVTGWMLSALASAKDAGLKIDEDAFRGGLNWIDEVSNQATGRVGYDSMGSKSSRTAANEHFPREKGEAMTAVGLLCRVFLGQYPKGHPIMEKHADLLRRTLPVWDPEGFGCDMYYWYYGTHAMFQMGGSHWRSWNVAMKKAVLESQRKDGDEKGSWDPVGPWGKEGGRVYATAMMSLCLVSETGLLYQFKSR